MNEQSAAWPCSRAPGTVARDGVPAAAPGAGLQSRTRKPPYWMIPRRGNVQKRQVRGDRKQMRGCRRRRWEGTADTDCSWEQGFFWGVMDIFLNSTVKQSGDSSYGPARLPGTTQENAKQGQLARAQQVQGALCGAGLIA